MTAVPSHVNLLNTTFTIFSLESATFTERDAIYIILTQEEDGNMRVIDVGESPEYGAPPINAPERIASWQRHAHRGKILVGTHFLPTDENMREDRVRIIAAIRAKYHPPAGAA